MDFKGLDAVLKRFDSHGWKGSFSSGDWRIANGGYDLWFELYYQGQPVAQCVAGVLSSNFGLDEADKNRLLEKILKVYDHLKVENDIQEDNDSMDERFEKLKRELFMGGLDDIEDFLGYEIDDEEYDVIENRLDMAFDAKSDTEMEAFYAKFHILNKEAALRFVIPVMQRERISPADIAEELSYRERAGVKDGHAGWDDGLIDYSTEELEVIEAAWSEMEAEKVKVRVAIESTDDYSEPGFYARLVEDDVRNEDGTYGKIVEMYRIVRINENGRIDRLDERVFESASDARAAVLENKGLELVGYDELVREAGRGLHKAIADAEAQAKHSASQVRAAEINYDFQY